ncbi:hypothetical protein NE237_026983 [Protea cynaroides]|uniref:Long-chain-fatty-acid--CoA ligase n=1 Tax=Protea cynaroides TaxID=273540 RepID=A0A9Q0GLP9_9MAGN|nr:hypothetical protein NE237_026983 [Protea cynaroides]
MTSEKYIFEVEAGKEAKDGRPSVGPVYRSVLAKDGLACPPEGLESCWDVFRLSVEKYPGNRMLGRREIVNGKAGKYVWLTYKEVHDIVMKLGHSIRSCGVEPGGRCGIYGVNCPEWMISMQACNAHGIYCVPLYDTLGAGAVEYIICHAEVSIAFAEEKKIPELLKTCPKATEYLKTIVSFGKVAPEQREEVEKFGLAIYSWDEFLKLGDGKEFDLPAKKKSDICTIMYTSGTTGDPKGVLISNDAIITLLAGIRETLQSVNEQLTSDDVYMSYLPLAHIFDRVIEELFIQRGGSIGFWRGDVKSMLEDLGELKPTMFCAVPRVLDRIYSGLTEKVSSGSFLKSKLFNIAYSYKLNKMKKGIKHEEASPLCDNFVFNKVKQGLGGNIRLILCGAAPLANHVEAFLRVVSCAHVLQGYGLTETCAGTFVSLPNDISLLGTVGPPVSNVDACLESVPEMGYDALSSTPRGEICIRGGTLFSGYHKREDLTKEVLIDGWFHTGDIGEWQPNGAMKIIDRKKNIFKLSQGEYVAVENLENIYGNASAIETIWVYGNSFESFLIAVVNPNQQALKRWAEVNEITGDFNSLCENPKAKEFILGELTKIGKENKLKGFEFVKAVHLDPVLFDLERDLITPTYKKKRPQLLKYYQSAIDNMYKAANSLKNMIINSSCLYTPPKIASPPFKSFGTYRQKISSLQSAVKLKHPRLELLKHRLIRHADAGHLDHALSTLDFMSQQGIPADLVSYSVLLKFCIRSRDLNRGKIVHVRLIESGIELDTVVLNSLISLYSKCGDWETAKAIFDQMGNGGRDLVSWSAMISCFSHSNQELQAIATFYEMLESGYYPNQFCFAGVIQACSNAENFHRGLVIFGFLMKTGYLESDLCVGCALIDMFVKGSGDMVSARKMFDDMPERNVVAWTLMITRYAQSGCPVDAIGLFLDMELSGFTPDRFTVTSVISACAELGSFQLGQQLHSRVIKSGLAFDVCVGCSLVDMYAKCASDGLMDCSRKVFDRMPDHNVMSWTAIITGYMQCGGCDEEAVGLFCEMIQEGVIPNHFTFSSVLKSCGNLPDPVIGQQVYAHAVKLGLASVNSVGNSIISIYARSGRMEEARKAFDILLEKNLVSYNTIIDGYAKNMNSEEAFELFHQSEMMESGVSAFTFASLLSGAASIGSMDKGEQLHARLLKAGFESNQCIGNALISMYSRCGNIEAASKVFNEMEEQNVISWTSMITGFAKHGYAREALKTYNEMVETGTKPNGITFIAVLSACSHVGMIPEGWKYFTSMKSEHGIIPRMEHYACMVDLLCRSGFFGEALEFIYSMPFKADALVWRTLLGACQVRGNMDIGKLAAEHILELEPQDPAAYILLSNLYASMGQWDNVVEIRKSMKERKMIKEAGCSWIELGNKVHKFHVGDTSHSRAREIYAELDRIASKIKSMGYVPDTDFVLHDVKEEQKEQYLLQHSEKIAVAFGLISTPMSRAIRIFKNLRVCGDCHTALKFISEATGREIVNPDLTCCNTVVIFGSKKPLLRGEEAQDGSENCNSIVKLQEMLAMKIDTHAKLYLQRGIDQVHASLQFEGDYLEIKKSIPNIAGGRGASFIKVVFNRILAWGLTEKVSSGVFLKSKLFNIA